MDRGAQKVLVKLTTTLDGTGKVIDCVEKRAESDIERVETASGTGRRKDAENEGIEVEDLFISHMS
jgi:hypothetical protein